MQTLARHLYGGAMRRWSVVLACFLSAVIGANAAFFVGGSIERARRHARVRRANGVFRVQTGRRMVALTFDDGPDPRWTPEILDFLHTYHAHATFFLVGRNAEAHPELVKAELEARDEIGNHTFDHPDLELLSPPAVMSEIERGANAIRHAGAPRPKLFRPPKGLTDEVVGVLANANRYRTIFWDLTVEHFVDHAGVVDGVRELLEKVRPGSIILAHDGGIPNRARTVHALPLLLRGLYARGYRVVTVSQLLANARRANVAPR